MDGEPVNFSLAGSGALGSGRAARRADDHDDLWPPPPDIGAARSLNPRYVPARGHAGLVTRIVLAGGGDRRLAAAAG